MLTKKHIKDCQLGGKPLLLASVLCFLLFFKAVYLMGIIGVAELCPATKDSEMARYDRIQWASDGHPTIESYFTTWDAGHYLYLCKNGYQAGQRSCAFYPLWPLLIHYVSKLSGLSNVIIGLLLANMLSAAAFTLFYHAARQRYGESIAWSSIILLLAFPGSLFFQFLYSESLFFFLIMGLSFALDNGHIKTAIAAAFLLPLTRAPGILCIVPIVFHLISKSPRCDCLSLKHHHFGNSMNAHFPKEMGSEKVEFQKNVGKSSKWLEACLVSAPILGWTVYFLLMWRWTGNPMEGFAAQKYWGVQSVHNLVDIPKFLKELCEPTTWHGFKGSLLDRCFFILFVYSLPAVWRLDKCWLLWAIVLGIIPGISGSFTSYIRFSAMAFPAFIALAVWFERPERKGTRMLVLAFFAGLQGLLLWRFIHFEWAN